MFGAYGFSPTQHNGYPQDGVVMGEIALSGEVRPVAHGALRLKEAAKLGFGRAMVPARRPFSPTCWRKESMAPKPTIHGSSPIAQGCPTTFVSS